MRSEGFETWYRREHPRVLAACLALAPDADLARESTDEALTVALERWPSVQEMRCRGGWVQTVGLNKMRRALRRRRLERLLPVGRAVKSEPVVLADEELWAMVRSLPRRQQNAVMLRYVADLTELDIAEVMGVSRGTVASTLHDARRRLRHVINDPLIAEEALDG